MSAREKVSDERLSFLLTKCVQCFTSDEGCDGTPCETYAALNELYERRRAERLRTSQEWVDVREGLPEDHIDVIVAEDGRYVKQAHRNGAFWYDDNDGVYGVTHWKPMPPPPRGEAP